MKGRNGTKTAKVEELLSVSRGTHVRNCGKEGTSPAGVKKPHPLGEVGKNSSEARDERLESKRSSH